MKLINTFFLILVIGIVAFFSFFWIGSYDHKLELNKQLPFSFIFRFLGLSTIGMIGIGFLILFNYLIKNLIFKGINISDLKKLVIRGVIAVGIVSLIGTIIFFL